MVIKKSTEDNAYIHPKTGHLIEIHSTHWSSTKAGAPYASDRGNDHIDLDKHLSNQRKK